MKSGITCGILFISIIAYLVGASCSDSNSVNQDPVDPVVGDSIIVNHLSASAFDEIPENLIDQITGSLKIFYGHTSHGSQIITGLNMLESENSIYVPPAFYEYGDDLGLTGDISWVQPTRDWLDDHPDYNVVIWSWCGGCSDNTADGISAYLNAMNQLEADYPEVIFIYMTGHLDGSGVNGNLYARNNQIRAYCESNDKVLFDFADIESYNPDGVYFPDETDACGWCETWCTEHSCVDCDGCAHSHCFNCYQKGKAFWWLMARLVGWDGNGS